MSRETVYPVLRTPRSPNQGARPAGVVVSGLVLHADAAAHAKSSVSWCLSPASKVSYHALIDRSGTVTELVDPQRRAWHAGVSEAGGVRNANDFTVGVCFSNRNDGVEPYTEAQIESGVRYCAALLRRFPAITPERVWTHAAVARPVGRKTDPGPLFPLADFLARLRAAATT